MKINHFNAPPPKKKNFQVFFPITKKPGTDQVCAAGMAQNTHRTELLLMFKKINYGLIFGTKCKKNIAYDGIQTGYLSIR